MPFLKMKQPLKKVFVEGMVLNHYPDSMKSRGSYLLLLNMAAEENPLDDRMTHYLGREYMYLQQWGDCIKMLKQHLQLPTASLKEERCASMRFIARAYDALGNHEGAAAWYFRAISEVPCMYDAYVEFAKMCYHQEDWSMVYYLIHEALKVNKRSETYINSEAAWDYTLYDLGAISCFQLKLCRRSLEYTKQALALNPHDF